MCEYCGQPDWYCKHKKLESAKQIKTTSFPSELNNDLLKFILKMDNKQTERAKKLTDSIKARTEQMMAYYTVIDSLQQDNMKDMQELEVYWTAMYQQKK